MSYVENINSDTSPNGAPENGSRSLLFANGGHSKAQPSTLAGAVVVGGDFQGLGIVRSLGRRGVPVCVIDDERSISRFSHYTTYSIRLPNLREESRIVDGVLEVGRNLGLQGWVLYPTREEIVAAFSRCRPILAEFFRVPTPQWSAVQWAWDKRNTYRLATELGIPTPRTWYPESLDDLRALESELPLVIKPAIKEHFIYASGVKAWRADSPQELAKRFIQAAKLVDRGEVMVQEMIKGDGRQQFAYCAFFKEGEILGGMAVRRRRQHPPEFGRASTFVETIELPAIETLSKRFLSAADYYGLVELEYKLDPRDGQYKLLDVNARTWAYHALGLRAGVDFPFMLYADQTGQLVNSCRAAKGVNWVRLVTDLPTGMFEILAGRMKWREYIRSLKSSQIESVFSRDDLLPGIVEIALIPYLMAKRGF